MEFGQPTRFTQSSRARSTTTATKELRRHMMCQATGLPARALARTTTTCSTQVVCWPPARASNQEGENSF